MIPSFSQKTNCHRKGDLSTFAGPKHLWKGPGTRTQTWNPGGSWSRGSQLATALPSGSRRGRDSPFRLWEIPHGCLVDCSLTEERTASVFPAPSLFSTLFQERRCVVGRMAGGENLGSRLAVSNSTFGTLIRYLISLFFSTSFMHSFIGIF